MNGHINVMGSIEHWLCQMDPTPIDLTRVS